MITRSEGDIAIACDALATACGWTVERYEQRRQTRICEGLPDRRYVKRDLRVWCELKRPCGQLTQAQHAWLLSELDAGGMACVIDDEAQLRALFNLLGRRSSIGEAEAKRICRQLVDLAALRGYRKAA